MKRMVLMVLLMSGCYVDASAQNWDEWVRQKRTQIRYLVRQIAGLQVYIELGQEGYTIANNGLQLISDIKNGDFDLHKGYFSSLSTVREGIGKSGKVAEVVSLYKKISEQMTYCRKSISRGDSFTDADRAYLSEMVDECVRSVNQRFQEFQLLISDGNYALSDHERMTRIEKVYGDMNRRYRFITSFYNEVAMLGAERQKELKMADRLKYIYDLRR